MEGIKTLPAESPQIDVSGNRSHQIAACSVRQSGHAVYSQVLTPLISLVSPLGSPSCCDADDRTRSLIFQSLWGTPIELCSLDIAVFPNRTHLEARIAAGTQRHGLDIAISCRSASSAVTAFAGAFYLHFNRGQLGVAGHLATVMSVLYNKSICECYSSTFSSRHRKTTH